MVLDKTEYLRKMLEILDDKTKFVKIGPASDFDKITKIEKEILDTLKDMVCKKEISQETFNEVKPIGLIRPRLYGLQKMHKREVPLRPIFSMTKSPQHKLARFLNILLKIILNHFSRFVVKGSFEVAKLKVATSDVQFSFNSEIYSQVDGMAMGFPLRPILANIFMGYLESKLVDKLSSKALYIRYMDDCLVISQSEKVNETLLCKLNALHEKKFFH